MRMGYLLGPLTLVPLLGALFFVPHPGDEDGGRLRFDQASLALLVCHTPSGAFAPFVAEDASRPAPAGDRPLRRWW